MRMPLNNIIHYEKYSHGEAVGIGMYQITKLAESLDLTKTESSMQIKEILQKYNLPYECQVETKKSYSSYFFR